MKWYTTAVISANTDEPKVPFLAVAPVFAMAMSMESEAVFKKKVEELGLVTYWPKFTAKGWTTYADFACSVNTLARDYDAQYQERVVKAILGTEAEHLQPRLQRLFLMSYTLHTSELEKMGQPAPEKPVAVMHAIDRTAALEELNKKTLEFEIVGDNEPSHKLVNKMNSILQHGIVRHVPWEACTSRSQEIRDVEQEAGLNISEDGTCLVRVPAKDSVTDVSNDIKWEMAMRRRAIAMHISSLCTFQAATKWTEHLKLCLLAPPPPGHKKISWAQIKAADTLLWERVASLCRESCKKKATEEITEFQRHWVTESTSLEVRHCLLPLPGPASTADSGNDSFTRKLQNRLKAAEDQILAQKRRLDNGASSSGVPPKRVPKGGKKGDGKGAGGVMTRFRTAGFLFKTGDDKNEPICFAFNLQEGCGAAQVGQKCRHGWHVCAHPACKGKREPHSASSH